MATRESIMMDYQAACGQASELEQIASNMKKMANNNLSQSLQDLSCYWQGSNAEAYLKKGTQLHLDITLNAKELENIASAIRTIAKNIYDAELKNIEIAESRNYQ